MKRREVKKVKKIILSLLTITAVSAFAFTATQAYFADTETVESNTFATGTLSFDIRGAGNIYPNDGIPVDASGMVPEVVDVTYFHVYNHNNSIDMKYKLYTDYTSGKAALYNKLRYRLYRCTGHLEKKSGDQPICHTGWDQRKAGWLKDLTASNYAVPVSNNVIPNRGHHWKLDLWLDGSAGNDLQGESTTFNILGVATQLNNPGWSE
jgi:predicted ribosomally synthesized peptide with SipW-like signal peptide